MSYGPVVYIGLNVHGSNDNYPYSGVDGETRSDAELANFTRVETFGARNTQWVSATIDPSDPNLFVFEPKIVAANAG